MLEPVIRELADRLSKQRGFRTPYDLYIKPELPVDSQGRDRIALIQAGSPPKIFISQLYIVACVTGDEKSGIPKLRDTVERCLEYVPKMQRTLSIVPIADAIALRKDSRKWARAKVPELRTHLPDNCLKITNIAVEVTDTITGTSIVRNGLDYLELIQRCKHDLSKMIIENEDMDDWREMVEGANRVKQMSVKAAEVSVEIVGNELQTKVGY